MPKPSRVTSNVTAASIGDLTPDPANLRRHPERNARATDASLKRFGPARSVVIDENGVVRAGNRTLESAIAAGVTEVLIVDPEPGQLVAVRRKDWSASEATAYAIADNRTAELAEWDDGGLAETLRALQSEDFDLAAVGYSGDEVDSLLKTLADGIVAHDDPGPQVDKADELRETWRTEPGQLWVIPSKATPGREHRLLCGDSAKADDVARVMGGEKADLCFTSPPYGQQRDYESGGIGDWDALMRGVFGNLPMADAGQVLVNLGLIHRDGEWLPYWDGWIQWMREQGWRRFGWYVWDQGPGMPGDQNGRLAPSFEFVFHFNRISVRAEKSRECKHAGEAHGGKGQRDKDGSVKVRSAGTDPVQSHAIHDSVIRVNRQGAAHDAHGHPAPFPPRLPAVVFESWPGLTFEPFIGSGTTIVAAEQTGRICYGIELAPKYVAVALQRLADMGLEPALRP